jgi:hypothetical protein
MKDMDLKIGESRESQNGGYKFLEIVFHKNINFKVQKVMM